ncbi:carbohydrate ABC transporter permease [Bifidobacterium olomucense]|uniref:ABC transporter permease n=1 Tax=Bifidobacterium olomucense TaxID=2675324 RepID=A0A7Y0EX65_9BIFI|nr:sugar ABC transporter permease [Bifidobacterium sp. DSM 109959]NMM98061.1 ABC transporter permease [Bifidobacterium sp. DSM 109959]
MFKVHSLHHDNRKQYSKDKKQNIGIIYCLPYIVVFMLGMIIPMIYSIYLGFFQTRMIGGSTFVGLDNYIQAFSDHQLWDGFRRVLAYFVIQVPVCLMLALLAALMLDSGRIKHLAVPRILLFLPYAVPSVIAALMWGYICGQQYGLVGQMLNIFSIPSPDLLSGQIVLFVIANIATWTFMGYNMLIYYSALRVIPIELYESARVDGASELRIAWSIKIPQIKGAIVMTVVFSVIGALQLFNEPNTLKAISPETITSYYTPNMYTYNLAFAGQNINYAAAASIVIGVITMILVAIVKIAGDKWEQK